MKSALYSVCLILLTGKVCALEMIEGEWELKVKYTISGMPIDNPEEIYRECFTQEDPIPTSFLKAHSCEVMEQRSRLRTVYYRLNCLTENGSIINEGKIHFSNRKISGDSKTDLGEVAGRNSVLRYRFTGRRLGECP